MVLRLPDPPPDGGARSRQSGWWPPAMLSAAWVKDHHEDFDVMHLHFGFDAIGPQQMRELVAELRRHRKPLVYTVHDLINPHQQDPAAHRALLDVLIPEADTLITLTSGAAREIHDRWGVHAKVLPHPHVVDFETMERIRASRDPGPCRRIGVHLKSLRPNMDPRILAPLARITARLPRVKLQVNIHTQPMNPEHAEYQPQLARMLQAGAEAGQWKLVVHEYFSEPELFAYLASLDISVLPYRFGTHSGWLEAALDVGTHVAVPDCGHYTDQDASLAQFRLTSGGVDEDSLDQAVRSLLRRKDLPGLDATGRRIQRQYLANTHHEVYAELMINRQPDASNHLADIRGHADA
ncbi:glycosyltransferase [Paeniglutamicibacter antarcticus]